MKKLLQIRYGTFLLMILLVVGLVVDGNTQCQSKKSGNWNDPATWTGCGTGDDLPASTSTVLINKSDVVTINGTYTCASLNLTPPATGTGTVIFNTGSQLTVNGMVTLGATGDNNQLGNLNMTAGGTLITTGLVVGNAGANVFTAGTGTIELTATNTIPSTVFNTFNNVLLSGGTTTFTNNKTVNGKLEVGSGATLSMGATTLTQSGDLKNNGIIQGTGTITLSGNYDATSTGSFNPGPGVGTLNISGNLNMGSSVFNANLNGNTGGSYDVLAVTDQATLSSATLNVTWGFTPSAMDVFTVMTFGSRVGEFNVVSIPSVAGLSFTTSYNSNNVVITAFALPVELLSFRTTVQNNTVWLNWQTASESNNQKFVVQRSQDGQVFQPIAELTGAGNSTATLDYQFIDVRPMKGLNYYRLKQVDYDGQFEYSPVEVARIGEISNRISVYPTVTKDIITINLTEESPVTVTVVDYQGKIALEKTYQLSEKLSLDLSGLSAGTYVIRVKTDSEVSSERVMKMD